MKNLANSGLMFSSENIRILMQEDEQPKKYSRLHMIESRASFSLLFLLSPNIRLEAHDCETKFLFRKNQYILHYSSQESTAELWTENQEAIKYFQIQINYQYIFNLIDPESSRENAEILENMIRNNYIFLHKKTPPYMTVEMHMILNELISYSKKGMMQRLFVEAKIIKLLILIFEQFNEKNKLQAEPGISFVVKKFIDENYHKNIRAEDIGKLTGISQNKIRKEFKFQYKMTVADYISDLRMLKAKKMIIDKDILVKEIAIECGYEYVQNFTRAFKKKFGVSPEKLRNG
ncbi:helix-turn-helix transcriptional regulator [Chryseobacterium lathyri]|uniref:helix-turn-helix transcriptional regulator n=1 Tax=Chryseobacterium lathyri TaxID=395933 RepID=UPI00278A9687|nr:AraC family transcriptional regulator [Chryseobacterium lathyri]MDQ0067011.1 AraC-like DNA-binding protein [Chryseobacterium lathyri]